MIYYLLANNSAIKDHHIDQMDLDQNNVLILFNYMIPMSFGKVKNYTKKYVFCRLIIDQNISTGEKPMYSGLEELRSTSHLFEKICLHPYPEVLEHISINLDRIISIDNDVVDFRKKYRYPRYKNMSTGFIVYNYIDKIKNVDDKIILVGFTSEINRNYHHHSWETKFFREEIKKGKCELIW
jgi:hypothetical protein